MKSISLFFILTFSFFAQATELFDKCLRCHNSNSTVAPHIQGQNRHYLSKQLFDFKFKNRSHEKMNQVAATLSDSDIESLADYFSKMAWPESIVKNETPSQIFEQGKQIANQVSCSSCHGESLKGLILAPRIAGQNAAYLEQQLLLFKNHKRSNDLGQMSFFAVMLSPEDIKSLSHYLSALP